MKINGSNVDIDDLLEKVNNDASMIKMRGNGIFLSDNEVNILRRYGIDYSKYNSLSTLIFDIENILNEESDLYDLEEVSKSLSEIYYYNNTNK